ncbi:MAG: prepilin-type N-terminal cleavage/methylation domain-containing protein [Candidatus Binatia bacterium]
MKRQRGFTLLEVMIATAIMAVGIVGALELFSGSLKLAGDASKQSAATVLARSLIDEELWRDLLENNQRSGTEGNFAWSVSTQPIDREMIGRDEDLGLRDLRGTGELGLWLIEAEVSWEGPSGRKALVLETARIGQLPE